MYCKLFTSLYQGTLRGKPHEILVFTNMLAHCDRDGFVDMHFRAIAEEIGITEAEVRAAIERLEQSDPESRTPDFDGRRLVRMDGHRAWGWRVVNYVKYRNIRNADDRKMQNADSQQRYRERNHSKPPSASVSQGKPPSAHAEVDAEAEVDAKATNPPKAATAARGRFVAPSLDEWQRYGQTLTPPFPVTQADSAFDHYAANGWKQARGNVIKNWQAACRNCHRRWLAGGFTQPQTASSKQREPAMTDAGRLMVIKELERERQDYVDRGKAAPKALSEKYWRLKDELHGITTKPPQPVLPY